jgi:hypothetical protein
MKCEFWFSVHFSSVIFFILKTFSEILSYIYVSFHLKCQSDFTETWVFSTDIRKFSTFKFRENPSIGRKVSRWGQTDGEIDLDKLLVAIRSPANAPKYAWISSVEFFELNDLGLLYFQINSIITKINSLQACYCTELLFHLTTFQLRRLLYSLWYKNEVKLRM